MRKEIAANSREDAELLAIRGLTFLAADVERLEPFLSLTGLDPGRLRAAASQPNFLAGVLDHLAGDESLLLQFAAHEGIDPARIARARAMLAGPTSDWGA